MSARLSRADVAVLGWTILFLGWVSLDLGGPRLAPLLDLVLFAGIAGATAVAQGTVALRLPQSRERLAWGLLVASSASRLVSGSIWGLWVELTGTRGALPAWLTGLGLGYLVFGIAALLAFPSAERNRTDRLRARLDTSVALLGSLLLVWYFALGPMLRAEGVAANATSARLNTLGDAVTAILAAWLYLRARSAETRAAAAFLLGAYVLQVIPDIGFWQLDWFEDYRAGDPVAAIWYGVWLLKYVSARAAARVLDATAGAAPAVDHQYRSGVVPHLFLVAATLLLLIKLLAGDTEDRALFIIGSALLTGFLIARQGVELSERDRLHALLRAEEGRYRALLQHAYDAVVVLDTDLRIRYASPATERLLGVGPRLTTPPSFGDFLHPEDADALRAAVAAITHEPQRLTLRIRDAAGAWRTLGGTLQDSRQDPLIAGLVFAAHDRTREERLAGGLREAQQFEALGVLASGLSHDLNNILTVISSHVELVRDDQTLDANARTDLEAIAHATDRARALTLGLLALSRRKQAAGRALALEPFVREFASRRPGVVLDSDGTPSDVVVRANPEALTQVLDAALEETREAREANGRVTIRTRVRELAARDARPVALDAGAYAAIEIGAPYDGPSDVIEPPVRASDTGDWDLAPSDLAMLMALAASREVGGTLVRERRGDEVRLTLLVPSGSDA